MNCLWDENTTGNYGYDDDEDQDSEEENEIDTSGQYPSPDEQDDDMSDEDGLICCDIPDCEHQQGPTFTLGGESGNGMFQQMSQQDIVAEMEEVRQEVYKIPLNELLDKIWPKFHGTGFCPLVARTNHSCDPNIKLFNEQNNHMMVARPLKQRINAGEQLTISYLDQKQNVNKRREILREYAFACNCSKCVAEGGYVQA